ncbi:fructose-1,6-bisphosphatase II [Alicyclobacillus sacchari]|uniref:Fructose-1,6-bisphosphatase n=1 Tax=Alicyclobacillus sacchari TaxID=392010 RepID=A0A4R8LSV4_9BACL|nr:class II fructose-bisphosphatase [Alicyclobacillus sacchari]TDY50654.1 fructose-1,6-bisphosphatase II [Alicyclobacillus sacchari]GMA55624.1 fructose-1,6-bisphosphatase [Alicyclobacillus sacchari]
MERELALELVRVTEAAALASCAWIGRGHSDGADGAATTAIREMLKTVNIRGVVVIGEGEMDEAPMLAQGEEVGNGQGPAVDVAVDPIEGTTMLAKALPNAMSVAAIAPRGQLLAAPDMYMEKLACGPRLRGLLSLDAPLSVTLQQAAQALGKPLQELTVAILERDRHRAHIELARRLGVRVKLLAGGDVIGAIATALPRGGTDLYIGSGGAPEGVLAAVALRCLGGDFQGRLVVQTPNQRERCLQLGIEDPARTLSLHDLAGRDDAIFAATGITDGDWLNGVTREGDYLHTHSVVLRAGTGTIRHVNATHHRPLHVRLAQLG